MAPEPANGPDPAPLAVIGERIRSSARLTALVIATVIGACFVFLSRPGLMIGFDADDVTNLYRAWAPSWTSLLLANLTPFSTFYRPVGALYYRLCFALFGWNPHAFRFVTYGVMLANLYLLYRVAKRLTKSAEIGVIAALLYSFHGHLRPTYVSNGTVYDVLCCGFSLLLLWYCMNIGEWAWRKYAIAAGLFVAALNAKETAAILPAIVFLYGWIYHPARLRKYAAFSLLLLAISAGAFWGKRQPGSPFYGMDLYAPVFTLRQFFANERMLVAELFYQPLENSVNSAGVFLFYAGLFAIAWLIRRKHLWLMAWFALLGPLPALFVPYRGLYEFYVPLTAVAVYFGALLVHIRDWLVRTVWHKTVPHGKAWITARVALFLSILALLPFGRNHDALSIMNITDPFVPDVADFHDDLLRLNEPLPRAGKVLLERSQFPKDEYGPLMMMRLLYRDRDLRVDLPGVMQNAPDPAAYDRVIDFDGRNLIVTGRTSAGSNDRRPSN